jgi:NADH-ubiquinone oxidoreductase chain 5
MYLTIILLPLLSAFISGFMGRKIGIKGSQILSCLALTLASILATIAFYEVGLNESSISIVLFNWIDSESMQLSWAFLLDSLSVSMLLPVLWVSTAVHYYSIGYMEGDPAKCSGKTFFGCKLSNSGEPLKLMVPSHSRKAMCG